MTHYLNAIGFRRDHRIPKEKVTFGQTGKLRWIKITIHKNRGICAHVGYCTSGLPAVFAPGEGKGIDPDAASVDEIIEVINKCPSGSLSYSIDGVEY